MCPGADWAGCQPPGLFFASHPSTCEIPALRPSLVSHLPTATLAVPALCGQWLHWHCAYVFQVPHILVSLAPTLNPTCTAHCLTNTWLNTGPVNCQVPHSDTTLLLPGSKCAASRSKLTILHEVPTCHPNGTGWSLQFSSAWAICLQR